jgi:hypothetical protein
LHIDFFQAEKITFFNVFEQDQLEKSRLDCIVAEDLFVTRNNQQESFFYEGIYSYRP